MADIIKIITAKGNQRRIRDLTKEQVGPEIFRLLHNTWNAQGEFLRVEDIERAFRTGQLSPEVYAQWRKDYIKWTAQMGDQWITATARGNNYMLDGLFASGAIRERVKYDTTRRAMQTWIRNRGAMDVTNFTNTQREGVQFLLDYFITEKPLTVPEMGRVLRNSVGLNKPQQKTLANTIAQWKADGLSKNNITAKAFRLETKMTNKRALNIANNEIKAAYNAAHMDAYSQVQESGLLTEDVFGMVPMKEWDDLGTCACVICCGLNGIQVPFDQEFPGGYFLPPDPHVGCDCSFNMVLADPAVISGLNRMKFTVLHNSSCSCEKVA